jgi:hypothetical protein
MIRTFSFKRNFPQTTGRKKEVDDYVPAATTKVDVEEAISNSASWLRKKREFAITDTRVVTV